MVDVASTTEFRRLESGTASNRYQWDIVRASIGMPISNLIKAVYLRRLFRFRSGHLSAVEWRFGLSTFRSVDALVCWCFGMSTFWFVDALVCRRFGFSTFWPATYKRVHFDTPNPFYKYGHHFAVDISEWISSMTFFIISLSLSFTS